MSEEKKEIKSEIVELFKNEGLELTEEAAKMAVKTVFKIMPIIAAKTDNAMDDVLVAAIAPILEREALKLVDKINPED